MDHITINVRDLDASVKFYSEVLGMTMREDLPPLSLCRQPQTSNSFSLPTLTA